MHPGPFCSRDEHPNRWWIRVRGHPARVKDILWREAIRDEVKARYPEAPFPAPAPETKFEVEVTFRMTPKDLARPAFDLDNFVKPVLDTIFTSQNVSRGVTGVLFQVNFAPTGHPGSELCLAFSLRVEAALNDEPSVEQPMPHLRAHFAPPVVR
jgi:hypothetical protein